MTPIGTLIAHADLTDTARAAQVAWLIETIEE